MLVKRTCIHSPLMFHAITIYRNKICTEKKKVKIISDRIINVKLAYGNSILNVISAYAPQVGCPNEEKSQLY